jgi:hypothetical protein
VVIVKIVCVLVVTLCSLLPVLQNNLLLVSFTGKVEASGFLVG